MTWIDWDKESKLVKDVQIGLEAALDSIDTRFDDNHFTGISGFNDANVKTNKFVYMVIHHFNLPILRTWFRYGQYEPHEEFSPQNLHPQPLARQTNEPMKPSIPNRNFPSPDEIKGYLLSEGIDEMVQQDMWSFMEDNYSRYAPKDLKAAYLANLNILKILEEIKDDPRPSDSVEEYYSRLKKESVILKQEIFANPLFDENIEDHLEEGIHTLRQALKGIYAKGEPIQRGHRKEIISLRWTYHERVWRWAALAISSREAKGAEAEVFRDGCKKELNEASLLYIRHLENQKTDFFNNGYFPKAELVSSLDMEIDPAFAGLRQSVIDY